MFLEKINKLYLIIFIKLLIINLTHSENSSNYSDYDYDQNSRDDNTCFSNFVNKLNSFREEGFNKTITRNVKHINDTFDIVSHLFSIANNQNLDKNLFSQLAEILYSVELSPLCLASIIRISQAIREKNYWALKFIDSTAKIPVGLTEGVLSDFGDYEGCLGIKSPQIFDNSESPVIYGQYCLAKVVIPYPPIGSFAKGDPNPALFDDVKEKIMKPLGLHNIQSMQQFIEILNYNNGSIFRLGICLPSTCEPNEIASAINQILTPSTRLLVDIGPDCQLKHQTVDYDIYQIVSITILVFLTCLALLSTGYDIYLNYYLPKIVEKFGSTKTYSQQLLTSFSIITNTRSLFAASNARFEALDTIRLLIIINVFIIHIYNFTASFGIISLKKILTSTPTKLLHDNRYFFLRSAQIIDALFTLSGFMLSYGLLGKLEKTNGRVNFFSFLIERWIRLSVLMFGSFLFSYLLPISGDGPIWEYGIKWIVPACKDWKILLTSFLYISNFNNELEFTKQNTDYPICNSSTWFLSALYQLLVVGTAIVFIYYRSPRIGIYFNIIVLIIGLISSIAPQLFHINPYVELFYNDSLESLYQSFAWYLSSTTGYISSFFVGIFAGYCLRKNINLSSDSVKKLWFCSSVSIVLVYMWNNTLWRIDTINKKLNKVNVLLWFSFGKFIFASGFAWIYFACCSGRGGIINKILSWNGFRPLVRLSFGFYLLQNYIIFHRIFSVKETFVMTDALMVKNMIFDLTILTGLAFIFYILIESPFSNLMKILSGFKPEIHIRSKNGQVFGLKDVIADHSMNNVVVLQKHTPLKTYKSSFVSIGWNNSMRKYH